MPKYLGALFGSISNPPILVAVGATGNIAVSSDSTFWTSVTSSFGTTTVRGVTWAPSLKKFCAVGDSGKIATSPDGINWTQQTSGTTNALRHVAWSAPLGLFVAVGVSGTLLTSPDGVTWTSQTSSFGTTQINRVCWSTAQSKFVAVGLSAKIATSSDGTTWTQRTNPFSSSLFGAIWNDSQSLFHVSGSAGGVSEHGHSSDGITWSLWSTAPTDTSNDSAGFAGSSLLATGGGHGKLDTSPTGATWTGQVLTGIQNINDMVYSPSLGLYVLAGDGGGTPTPYILSSVSGTGSWTSQNITTAFGTTNPVNGICASS